MLDKAYFEDDIVVCDECKNEGLTYLTLSLFEEIKVLDKNVCCDCYERLYKNQ